MFCYTLRVLRLATSTIVVILCLPASAGYKTAVVYNSGGQLGPRGEMPCEMRLKAALRELGYVMLSAKEKEKAHLRIGVSADCTSYTLKNNCSVRARVNRRGYKSFSVDSGKARHDSIDWALDEACRELTKLVLGRLEGKQESEDVGSPGKTSRIVSVRFKGVLKPMPLIKLTGFFKDMGYKTKLTKSGANQVAFRVTFEDSLERFRSKLRTFLEAHYRIISTSGESKLNFEIGER